MSEHPIKRMLAGLPTYVGLSHAHTEGERKTIVFDFSERGFGFGELTLVQDPSGLYVDSEHMGREKAIELVRILIAHAILDTDADPALHKRYNEAMHRTCAESCRVCHPEGTP